MPFDSLGLALCHSDCPQSQHFANLLAATVGSPIQLTIVGMAVFYATAWARGIKAGELGVVACLLLVAIVDRHTFSDFTVTYPQAIPLLAIAAIELSMSLPRLSSFRFMVAATAIGLSATNLNWFAANVGLPVEYFWHVNPLVMLVIAAAFNDAWSKVVRTLSWVWLPVIAVWISAQEAVLSSELGGWAAALLTTLASLGLIYWYRERSWERWVAAIVSITSLSLTSIRWYYATLEASPLSAGLPWLSWGMAALSAAILVSLGKSGLLASLMRSFRRFGDGPTGVATSF